MSRQKDTRRALMLAQMPESEMVARRLQELAMSPGVTDLLNASKAEPAFADGEKKSRSGFAYGGAPFEFTPFVAPQYNAITNATIQPGAIAPPRPPDPPALPWPTPPADERGRRGRFGRDLAQQIASNGMGPVPGARAWGAPDGGGAGNTTANNYGGSYAGAPGLVGVAQSLYDGQQPSAAQIGQAIAGPLTGLPGLGISLLGLGLNHLGFSPSQNPHGAPDPDDVNDADTGAAMASMQAAAAAQAEAEANSSNDAGYGGVETGNVGGTEASNTGGPNGLAAGGGVDPDEGPVNDPQRQLTPLGMYSHAAETARALPQAQDTREGMISALTARGVRANEMQQSGVREAFPAGKVTKDQLVGHFQQALPPLQETINGSGWVTYGGYAMTEDGQPRRQLGRRLMPVPGYREILLHLPEIHGGGVEKTAEKNQYIAAEAAEMAVFSGDIDHVGAWWTAPQKIKDPHLEEASKAFTDSMRDSSHFRKNFTVPGTEPNFWGDHWPIPNVVAHIRVQGRKDPTGKKVLHLEELQSDWGQALRQQARPGLADPSEHPAPAGPYVGKTEDWTDLGLKRALIEAARGGHDKLVWTPGSVQNARYDLVEPEGGEAMSDDARRAGEGMRRYYDQMLPQRLRAITKGLDPSAQIGLHDMGKMGKLPGIDITPRMRAAILRGLPAYQRGGLIQDKYPTHYMPDVGRQVMADGGYPQPPPTLEAPATPTPQPAPQRLTKEKKADGGAVDPDTDQPREFDPSRIFALADGGLVDRALQLIRTKVPALNRKAFSV